MVSSFAACLGYTPLAQLLHHFQERICFGVSKELLDIMRVHSMLQNAQRARFLYEHGMKTCAQLAASRVETLSKLLRRFIPFASHTTSADTSAKDATSDSAESVWLDGGRHVTESEAAQILINEARQLIKLELNAHGMRTQIVKNCSNCFISHYYGLARHF